MAVAKEVLRPYNVVLTPEACKAATGKRPLEAWQALVDALQLRSLTQPDQPACAQELLDTSEPLLTARLAHRSPIYTHQLLRARSSWRCCYIPLLLPRWCDARLLPGALRLLRHLAAHGVPYALATSTPRATLNAKLATKPELRQLVADKAVSVAAEALCGW
jgi:riboflavin kinase